MNTERHENNYNEDCDKEEEEVSDEKKGLKMDQSEKIKKNQERIKQEGKTRMQGRAEFS
jgi:hypothetical protein